MRVWLINPPTSDMIDTELPGYVSKEVGRFPPLGLLYLAAAVRAAGGHALRVVDMNARQMDYASLASALVADRPDLVGITGTTHNLLGILKTAAAVKRADPSIRVCLGGPHVDAFPREAVGLAPVDFAIRGEGEKAFPALLKTLADGGDLAQLPGLLWKDGAIVKGGEHAPDVEDLDALPFPARDLVDPAHYFYVLGHRSRFTTLISTRGCPFRCIFCSTPHGAFRIRAPGNIADEIQPLIAAGTEEFHFVDDTFNTRADRLGLISDEFLRRGFRIKWSFRGRVDRLVQGDLERAARAGCVRMHIGVETGTDEGLALLQKGITTAQVADAVAWARKAGITTAAYFLIGCPHEHERSDILRTIDFACRINPDFAMFNVLAIYPGTRLHAMAVERGLIAEGYWRDFASNPAPGFRIRFWEEHFSREELVDLLGTAYRRFYLRPRVVLRNLRGLASFAELRHKTTAAMGILFRRRRA